MIVLPRTGGDLVATPVVRIAAVVDCWVQPVVGCWVRLVVGSSLVLVRLGSEMALEPIQSWSLEELSVSQTCSGAW